VFPTRRPHLNQELARDAEALHIGRGALALSLRIDPEFLRTVAAGALAAIRRLRDFRRHCLPRLIRELEAKRIVDPGDRSNRIGDKRAIRDVRASRSGRAGRSGKAGSSAIPTMRRIPSCQ
jgi:hypothetical protein